MGWSYENKDGSAPKTEAVTPHVLRREKSLRIKLQGTYEQSFPKVEVLALYKADRNLDKISTSTDEKSHWQPDAMTEVGGILLSSKGRWELEVELDTSHLTAGKYRMIVGSIGSVEHRKPYFVVHVPQASADGTIELRQH